MSAAAGYQTVFDLHEKGFNWWCPAIGLIFLFAGTILIWLGKRNHWQSTRKWMGYVFVAFAAFWTISVFVGTYSEYSRVRSAYEGGEFATVEGLVTGFQPMPYEGHQDECFTISSQTFCYSDFDLSPGFNNSASHGGPIREGLPVRVAYVGNTIVRLEVRKDTLPSVEQKNLYSESALADWQKRQNNNALFRNISLGFAIAAILVTLWWNVQWQRFMKFWVKPPYKKATIRGFRIFFAANLIGAVWYLSQQILHFRHLVPIWPVVETAVLMLVVVWILVNAVEWINRSHI
jgi:hypothetical protein